jgi:acyl-coenzyme A synthetase/AMP-(fatty) acid ligase
MTNIIKMGDEATPLFSDDGSTISRESFARSVAAFAASIPLDTTAINLCADRFAFCVALFGLALRGKPALLPTDRAEATISDLLRNHPGARIASDQDLHQQQLVVPDRPARHEEDIAISPMPDDHGALAVVYTSGTTGHPQAHVKGWTSLRAAGQLLSDRLLGDLGRCGLVATVPPQHMYGLETSVMMAIEGGHCIHRKRPLFPEDIRIALGEIPEPRILITTPIHLRALVGANTPLPPIARIISSTAPLSLELAQRAEATFNAPVFEIYGCSEAGSMASRQLTRNANWHLLRGVNLIRESNGAYSAVAPHLQAPVPLQDVFHLIGAEHFRLLGRAPDLIKVGGKRASLADLTHKLLAIPGVIDGVVFAPDESTHGASGTIRVAAAVVAPTLTRSEILEQLRRVMDPAFLPRPLIQVNTLPRNSVGKLPKTLLQNIFEGQVT